MTADQVRYIRDAFGMSQRDFAKALNVSPATAARWETTNADGYHAPAGLQDEVLRALHNVAKQMESDPAQRQMIAGLLGLGLGALIVFLLMRR